MASKEEGEDTELVLDSTVEPQDQQELAYHDAVVQEQVQVQEQEHQSNYDYGVAAAGGGISNPNENKWNKNGFGQGKSTSTSTSTSTVTTATATQTIHSELTCGDTVHTLLYCTTYFMRKHRRYHHSIGKVQQRRDGTCQTRRRRILCYETNHRVSAL